MNNLAILPYICLHALQLQNVKRNVVKKVSINELNNKEYAYPIDNKDSTQSISQEDNKPVEDIPNQGWHSTKIADLPQPASIDTNNIGSEL